MVEQVFGRDRLTFGVEEEFLLVDAETRVAAARSDQVIAQARLELGDQIESEFYLSQLETHSEPCGTAAELRRDLARCRPRIIRIVVDLPAPFGPRNPVTLPGATAKSARSTASFVPYRLVSAVAWIMTPSLP